MIINERLVIEMMDAYARDDSRAALIGDFVAWATQHYPSATALEICFASQGGRRTGSLPTFDPFIPKPGLLLLISKLIQAREAMSIYADSAYRWLPSTIKNLCPAAQVFAPVNRRKYLQDYWQDKLLPGKYNPISTPEKLLLDAAAIIEYEDCSDLSPTEVFVDGRSTIRMYWDYEDLLSIARRVSDGGIFIWVQCDFDLEIFHDGSGYHSVAELTDLLKNECGMELTAAIESDIVSGNKNCARAVDLSAMVYVFEKKQTSSIPKAYDARLYTNYEEDRDLNFIDEVVNKYRRGISSHIFAERECLGLPAIELKKQIKSVCQKEKVDLVPWLKIFEPNDREVTKSDPERLVTFRGESTWPIFEVFVRDFKHQAYFQTFFQSKLGRDFVTSCAKGRNNKKYRQEYFEDSKVPLPNESVQQAIVRASSIIDEIEIELRDCESQLWTGNVNRLNGIVEQLGALRRGDSTQRWAESMCLPLASILVPYSTNRAADPNEKVERLLTFFESLTAWLAIVCLSKIRTLPSKWIDLKVKLRKQKQHVSFKELTFGGWRTILQTGVGLFSLDDDKHPSHIEKIMASELHTLIPPALKPILAVANNQRNNRKHGPLLVAPTVAARDLEELHRLLVEVHKQIGHSLNSIKIVTPGLGENTEDGYRCELEELTGQAGPFPKFSLLLNGSPPVRGKFYLLSDNRSELIEMFPLLNLRTELGKAFFYDRQVEDNFRFKSHHNPASPEIMLPCDSMSDLNELINFFRVNTDAEDSQELPNSD